MTAAMPVENTDNYWTEKSATIQELDWGWCIRNSCHKWDWAGTFSKTAPEVTSMLKEGVKLTAGEMAGGAVKRRKIYCEAFQ